jgi:hypothetical protein
VRVKESFLNQRNQGKENSNYLHGEFEELLPILPKVARTSCVPGEIHSLRALDNARLLHSRKVLLFLRMQLRRSLTRPSLWPLASAAPGAGGSSCASTHSMMDSKLGWLGNVLVTSQRYLNARQTQPAFCFRE